MFIPRGTNFGEFQQCFILKQSEGVVGWMDAATLQPVGDLPLIYPDGLIVRISGSASHPIDFSGEVKPGSARSIVQPRLNLIVTPYPTSEPLQALGLENDLLKCDNPLEADKVWISSDDGSGAVTTY
ncbi:MAG: hypothetical protein ABI600_15085 [Luteolibacter sp.]